MLINSLPTSVIRLNQGVQQGCPLAPFLVTLEPLGTRDYISLSSLPSNFLDTTFFDLY